MYTSIHRFFAPLDILFAFSHEDVRFWLTVHGESTVDSRQFTDCQELRVQSPGLRVLGSTIPRCTVHGAKIAR